MSACARMKLYSSYYMYTHPVQTEPGFNSNGSRIQTGLSTTMARGKKTLRAWPSRVVRAVDYPSASTLKKVLGVCAAESDFSVEEVQSERRVACCIMHSSQSGEHPWYVGHEHPGVGRGYVIVSPKRARIHHSSGKSEPVDQSTLPIRLTRWIMLAEYGQVVEHTCDTPACIAKAHLTIGSHSTNARAREKAEREPSTQGTRSQAIFSPSHLSVPLTVSGSNNISSNVTVGTP